MKKLTKKTILSLALIGFLIVPMFALTAVSVDAACVGVSDATWQATEDCDGSDYDPSVGSTCADWAAGTTGSLACYPDCTIDTSGCTTATITDIEGWGTTCAPEKVPTDIKGAIMNVTNWILGFVTIIATLIVIYGGVLYLTAAGNEEMIEKAKKTISYGIIGIVICGLAYAIVIVVSTVILTA